jgi:hypothetical protein
VWCDNDDCHAGRAAGHRATALPRQAPEAGRAQRLGSTEQGHAERGLAAMATRHRGAPARVEPARPGRKSEGAKGAGADSFGRGGDKCVSMPELEIVGTTVARLRVVRCGAQGAWRRWLRERGVGGCGVGRT